MDQEKSDKPSSKAWLWILIAVVVVAAGLLVWYFSTKNDEETTSAPTEAAVVAPKHADWSVYTSEKYGFTFYYPSDYVAATGNTGTVKLAKGGVEMVDLYVYAANGDEAGMVKSQTTLFTDDTKGYMTGGAAGTTTIAGVSGTLINGVFGKNAGISQTHEGVAGATVFFPKDDKLFILDSYDNADPTAMQIFDDIVLDFRF